MLIYMDALDRWHGGSVWQLVALIAYELPQIPNVNAKTVAMAQLCAMCVYAI